MNIHATIKTAKQFAKEWSQIDIVRKVINGSDKGKYITFNNWELYDHALAEGIIRK